MLSNAVLSCLCYFGSFGYTAVGNVPILTNNTIVFDNYYDTNQTISTDVAHYHDRYVVNCDFRLEENENDPNRTDIVVKFNSFNYAFYIVSNTADSESLVSSSDSYYLNFDDCVLNDPNNTWTLSYYGYSTTSTSARWYSSLSYYYELEDDTCGITTQVSVANNPQILPLTGTFKANDFKVDLDELRQRVRFAFASAMGGYDHGYNVGYGDGKQSGEATGYQRGYADGYAEGTNIDSTAFTIFNGILNIGMIPINFFLAMFDFSILGINVSNFVMSILSVFVTIWLIRLLTGKKTDGN